MTIEDISKSLAELSAGAGLSGELAKNLFFAAVTGTLALIGRRAWNRIVLERKRRLAGHVFPVFSDARGRDPVIHLRASFDELLNGTNPPTLRGYTHGGDVQAIMSIASFFDPLPVTIEFDYFPEIREGMKNVVVVGASSRSDISRDLNAELHQRNIRIPGTDSHAHFRDKAGNEYRCSHQDSAKGALVTKDAGIIYRRTIDSGLAILLCAGLHTFGSQAAATVALMPEFQKMVRRSGFKQFVQFVTVDVVSSGDRAGLAPVRQSLRWNDLPLEKIE
jgi:hypothetical protein